MTEDKSLVLFTDETPQLPEEIADALKQTEQPVEFWLRFPIRIRPLKFVPGRNRREKRMFRKLADQQERGTISRGRQGRDSGGNLGKLNRLYAMLAKTGVLKQAVEVKK